MPDVISGLKGMLQNNSFGRLVFLLVPPFSAGFVRRFRLLSNNCRNLRARPAEHALRQKTA